MERNKILIKSNKHLVQESKQAEDELKLMKEIEHKGNQELTSFPKEEKNLLKQISTEVHNSNHMLNQILDKENYTKNRQKKTFAEVLAKAKPLEKKIQKLIVKRINNDNKEIDVPDIKTYIAHYINKNSTIQAKSIKIKIKDEAIISVINEDSLSYAT